DEIALAAIEQIGNGECRLRLADAARTHEHEDALGLVRIFNARTRGANALADERERVRLADEAPPQMILQLEHRAGLVPLHLAHRDARPRGDDFTHNAG